MVEFVRPTDALLRMIAGTIRHADLIEVRISGWLDPFKALVNCVRDSDYSAVAIADGDPIAVFGLKRRCALTNTGSPWLIGSEKAMQFKKAFIEAVIPGVKEMLDICPHLVNYVHAENHTSIRWLKRLGFEMDEPEDIGGGLMFRRFHMGKG